MGHSGPDSRYITDTGREIIDLHGTQCLSSLSLLSDNKRWIKQNTESFTLCLHPIFLLFLEHIPQMRAVFSAELSMKTSEATESVG